ncbi:multidrug resistance-associated protein 1 [Aplysia californica]|uniref:ABC-type glutathione-S-conjugate transporter n=1 Tax=Aplysia californica TaxID=6500 RepID=A0ABM1A7N1_APLCA|nr:multidrug resistance-associated protein 1 [Aplysia californica]
MTEFCNGEPFWDSELTWTNNSWPQFTGCFQNTALLLTPCAVLWVMTPFYILGLLRSKEVSRPLGFLFCAKQFCGLVTGLLAAFDLIKAASSSEGFNDECLSSLIWILTSLLHGCLMVADRSKGVWNSPLTFVFWLLSSLARLIPFYSAFELEMYKSDLVWFAIACLHYVSATVAFFLNCFSEYRGQEGVEHHPAITASPLSWLIISWMTRLVIRGFRFTLKAEDVFPLRVQDTSEPVVQEFLCYWQTQSSSSPKSRRTRTRKKALDEEPYNEATPLLAGKSYDSNINSNKGQLYSSNIKLYSHSLSIENAKNVCDEMTVEESRGKRSFFLALVQCYWFKMLKSHLQFSLPVLGDIANPFLLGLLMSYIDNMEERAWHGYVFVLGLVGTRLVTCLMEYSAQFMTVSVAIRMQSAAISTVFRKSLTMSSEARKTSTVGEIVNLMSVDSANIQEAVTWSFWSWRALIYLAFAIYFTYTVAGIALLAGLGYVTLNIVVNFWVTQKMRQYQNEVMVVKDERVKVMSEVLNGIKVIKLYGWEPMFIKRIQEIRERELKILLKSAMLDGFDSFAWSAASLSWMMFFILFTYVYTDSSHHLDAQTTFLTMNFIDLLQLAVNVMPIMVKIWVKAATSVKRMSKFLNSQDLPPANLYRDTTDSLAVRIESADFAWEKKGLKTLQNINVSVRPGQLVAVVGSVGAGKSSLLSAVLGEMHRLTGYSNINSSVAYVPQQAWIQNNTIRENIFFGKSCNPDYYDRVIRACALQSDLEILPAGDKTEIGEKGINLSGGQKQRVSLARAVYSDADIFLLDDPLSAVDSHVGRHIFNQVIGPQGILQAKTRVLVTHGIHWLPHVDHIYVMNNGQITEAGTYQELLSHNGPFAQFLTQHLQQDEEEGHEDNSDEEEKEVKASMLKRLVSMTSESEDPDLGLLEELTQGTRKRTYGSRQSSIRERKQSTRSEASHKGEESIIEKSVHAELVIQDRSRLTTDEEMATGKVKWAVYWELCKGFGPLYAVLLIALITCYQAMSGVASVWLTNWNDDLDLANFTSFPADSEERRDKNNYFLGVYSALGVLQTFFVVAYAVVLQIRHIAASRKLHNELLESVMHAPMSFFDTTPMGRILNRFSQDLEVLDSNITMEFETILEAGIGALATMVVIGYSMPIFIAFIVPIVFALFLLQQLYIRASCQLRRLASTKHSPVFAHFSETLSGVGVIRAHREQLRFINDSQTKVDDFQKFSSVSFALNKWLQARLMAISCVVVLTAGLFSVLSRDSMSPALVGLAVTYALRISTQFNLTVRIFGDVETHVVSVERMREYSVLASEASWVSSKDKKDSSHWPSEGKIEFLNYSTRYRPGLDLVLRGLTCTINPGEKVGIVGRTGAGKSSMVLSLFRLIESAGGQILIDGLDIASLGLHTLRRNVTILPQEPVLFVGTLRDNLDPFGEKTDKDIWTALEHSHLKLFVESLPQQLDHEVGEGGENLSMGQRQLLCLARTLLRRSRILVLDEATAAVDLDTDLLIQKTVRHEFNGCTILTIAHRLNTVLDYDRIMVLDAGRIIEFDSPDNLLLDPQSAFYSMAQQANLV